jgi:N-acetylneuraminate synthase
MNFEQLDTPYLIGEIGINHNGDLQIAKKLIDAVHACGWNCAKFQKRTPELCVPEHQKKIMKDTPWGKITYLEYKNKIELQKYEYDYIDKYCKEKPLDWTASVWDLPSLEFILNYQIPFIKIPSAMLINHELLIEVAKTKKIIVLSTGMSELAEIDNAVNLILKYGDKPILMHTNSSYPAPIEELNLSLIPFLKNRYKCTVGYSGHEEDLMPSVVAAVLGAKIIERHITLSHNLWGTDQKASLEVLAMDILFKRIINIKKMIGEPIKFITPSEIEARNRLRNKQIEEK